MRKISLFIAMSLDGYIADNNGGVNWLNGQGNDSENIDAYSEFVNEIDIGITGWNTYHQIAAELSVNDWPYEEFTTYVFTHKFKLIKTHKSLLLQSKIPPRISNFTPAILPKPACHKFL